MDVKVKLTYGRYRHPPDERPDTVSAEAAAFPVDR